MASPGSLPSASVDASGVRRGCRQRLRTCSITRRYEAYRDVSLKLKFVGAVNKAIEGLRERPVLAWTRDQVQQSVQQTRKPSRINRSTFNRL